MKRIVIFVISSLLAIILGLTVSSIGSLALILNLPMELIGDGLRTLSLSSSFLNAISIFIFILIGCIPLVILFSLHLKKKAKPIDWLFLSIMTPLNFLVLYCHINPSLLVTRANQILLDNLTGANLILLEDILLNGLFYIFLAWILIYLVIRFLQKKSTDYAKIFTLLVDSLLIVFIFVALTVGVINLRVSLAQTNIGGYDIAQFIITFVVQLAIYSVSFYLLTLFRTFIKAIVEKHSTDAGIESLGKLHFYSLVLIMIILATQIILNSYQLIFLKNIQDVSLFLNIPIIPLFVAIVTLIVSGYFTRMKAIEEENELII